MSYIAIVQSFKQETYWGRSLLSVTLNSCMHDCMFEKNVARKHITDILKNLIIDGGQRIIIYTYMTVHS